MVAELLPNRNLLARRNGAVTFGALLDQFRQRAGLSRSALARAAGIDAGYIQRLAGGTRLPSREFARALGRALNLSPVEQGRLLASAGYAPCLLERLGHWPDALQAVAEVLADEDLTLADRSAFADLVTSLAAKWRRCPLTVVVPEEVPVPDPRAVLLLGGMTRLWQQERAAGAKPSHQARVPKPSPDAETLRRVYCEEGLSVAALAHRYHVRSDRARIWLKAAGIPVRRGVVQEQRQP